MPGRKVGDIPRLCEDWARSPDPQKWDNHHCFEPNSWVGVSELIPESSERIRMNPRQPKIDQKRKEQWIQCPDTQSWIPVRTVADTISLIFSKFCIGNWFWTMILGFAVQKCLFSSFPSSFWPLWTFSNKIWARESPQTTQIEPKFWSKTTMRNNLAGGYTFEWTVKIAK